jgi:16S rRNA (guanine527-N7)-methyltransferase
MELIEKYFQGLSSSQMNHFRALDNVYRQWNDQINVISRKDIDALYERHVLHSLGIAKVMSFIPKARVLDVGTGGGFPGIPLAILFPETEFVLVDSIGKKIKVVNEVTQALGLKNVSAYHQRAELTKGSFDFVVTRAVTRMQGLAQWTHQKIGVASHHDLPNGILALKGGDLSDELRRYRKSTIYNLSEYFEETFFETKAVVHLPLTH